MATNGLNWDEAVVRMHEGEGRFGQRQTLEAVHWRNPYRHSDL